MIPASSTQPGRWEQRVGATGWDSVRADLGASPPATGRWNPSTAGQPRRSAMACL